nr:hypothetical protein [Pasteuria penetrans]
MACMRPSWASVVIRGIVCKPREREVLKNFAPGLNTFWLIDPIVQNVLNANTISIAESHDDVHGYGSPTTNISVGGICLDEAIAVTL